MVKMQAIDIKLRNRVTKTIQLNDNIQLVVDYPTVEQWNKLQSLLAEIVFTEEEIEKTTDKKELIKLKAYKVELMNNYMKLFLRYTIKDIKDNSGTIKVKVVNNELDEESYDAIVYDINQVRALFDIIHDEVSFNEIDKKK